MSEPTTDPWGQPLPQHPHHPPQMAVPAPEPRPKRARPSRWVWPAVLVLGLLAGIVGGAGGAALWERYAPDDWRDDTSSSVTGLSGSTTVSQAPIDPDDASVANVAQALLPSTVQIIAEYAGEDDGATGSGFVFDTEGHIVTNNHVVASAAKDKGPVYVVDTAGHKEKATIVGRSSVYDIAVLDVPGAKDLKPASLGAAAALRIGEPVVAFGSPLGLSATVTSGIVSALNRPVTTGESADDLSYINAVQTDAAINPGNSGGPLVNLLGQVVGVNSAIATAGGTTQGEAGNIGVGFAIPIEQVKITAEQLLTTGKASYPIIGAKVQTGTDDPAGDGAEVISVDDGTPAAKAGLAKGDIVTAVDGQRITDGIGLIVAIRTHQPGETVEFTVNSAGRTKKVSVKLAGVSDPAS
ncbi:S1C family serine protease [Nocardioides sp. Kera G14]|uniref:S1C family serine protease n=1 Tax=Nocardioides sp. Kera G14 TaxID=2884264 RepID=UPI001D117C21|nr:trypsin-like peptidase domain-containing protein [Nocardioides sp. Kera G14]UDY22827.1 trypsin-like peptidase domain-containing protein [Nocardioides sp. Kera G14]